MDNCSFFIDGVALFGSFPSQQDVFELENIGVRYFINLTYEGEKKIKPYITNYTYISFPLVDRNIPEDKFKYSVFITKIVNLILSVKNGDIIYIHCKGGHGRSGVVVSCILCLLYNWKAKYSIKYTNMKHNERLNMKSFWRRVGSPQTRQQKDFVLNFYKPLYINSIPILCLNSKSTIVMNKIKFDNIVELYLQNRKECHINNYNFLLYIIFLKVIQNKEVLKALLNTFSRPLLYIPEYNEPILSNLHIVLMYIRHNMFNTFNIY